MKPWSRATIQVSESKNFDEPWGMHKYDGVLSNHREVQFKQKQSAEWAN